MYMGSSSLTGAAIASLFSGKIIFSVTIGLIIGGVIGGAVGGLIRWNTNEEKYRNLIGNDLT